MFHRYGVLLTQRLNETDTEHTLALLDMVDAEEGQYQLGRTKVPFLTLIRCLTAQTCLLMNVRVC